MTPEQIKEIALRVAKEMWNMQGIYSGHPESEMIDFATRFLEEVQKASEPVATIESGVLNWLDGKQCDSGDLYLHPPVAPDGMVLVPKKATQEIRTAMRRGSQKDWPSDELCNVRWAAALAAAPKVTP